MRSILLALCGGLVGGRRARSPRGATAPARVAAPAAAADAGDKAALGKSIRDYLMANPEVLVEAMQELERKQDSQRDAVAQKAIQPERGRAAAAIPTARSAAIPTATSSSSSSTTTSAPTASAPTRP